MKAIFRKALELFVSGTFFIDLSKKHYIARLFDRIFSFFARGVLVLFSKVDPKKIIFIPLQKEYACNPKYICEEILRDEDCKDYTLVWTCDEDVYHDDSACPPNVKKVVYFSYEYFKEMATAKLWVVNSLGYYYKPIHKRRSQRLIQTWHGSLGIKRFDAETHSDPRFERAGRQNARITDYCISNSTFETEQVFRQTYWSLPRTQVMEFGHPRNDILFTDKGEALRRAFCAEHGLSEDTRFALYAPTHRDSKSFSAYNLDTERLVKALHKKYGGDWMVLTRYHVHMRKAALNNPKNHTIHEIDVTTLPDMQELICITDFAVTDYSSWIFDYLLLMKPGIIFATDTLSYHDERELYFPLESTPFPVCHNNDEVEHSVAAFDMDKFNSDAKAFLERMGCVDDGKASQRTVELIKSIVQETAK